MKQLSFMIKPASSLCNMRCAYCFYADVSAHRTIESYGLMTERCVEELVENIFSALDGTEGLTFAFQGGEPTLAGLGFFRHFLSTVAQVSQAQSKPVAVSYSLQTNGLVLDDAWCAFLGEHRFLVGLSLDGDAAMHDKNRVDPAGKGTFRRVMHAKALLEQYHVEYNILWVLTQETARRPQKVWSFLCAHEIRYVQFVPCLAGLEEEIPQALTPQRFASFYIALFQLWSAAFFAGEYRSVKLFDDLCNLLGRGNVTACGLTGRCQIQQIVEGDGSVYPCDFYVLDRWRLGTLRTDSPDALRTCATAQDFLTRPRQTHALCKRCEFEAICHGGCPRMERGMYIGKDEGFCGYQTFLRACGASLQTLGRQYARP